MFNMCLAVKRYDSTVFSYKGVDCSYNYTPTLKI